LLATASEGTGPVGQAGTNSGSGTRTSSVGTWTSTSRYHQWEGGTPSRRRSAAGSTKRESSARNSAAWASSG